MEQGLSGNECDTSSDQKYVDIHSFDHKDSGILGTIAGDDTLLLIIKSKEHLTKVLQLLQEEFPYLTV